ncbi:T6SS immunity protein Tdi1 domain-containing protein [Xenorhabdus szentirmaii]|uniref:T6SS immunity protein Tdi1 domain-containing protein n=1 Tax=Xenorhabdus szentirmaii TaxID=290112 RepID=UPI00387EC4F1
MCSFFKDMSFFSDDNDAYTDEVFDQAIEIHGPLEDNEIFCFEPAIYLRGEITLENIRKVDIYTHFNAQSQKGYYSFSPYCYYDAS